MDKKPYRRMRGNGQGSAYKRGRTWTATYTCGWEDGKPIKRTKGGFPTKREALEYIPILKAARSVPRTDVPLSSLFADWEPFYAPRVVESTMKGLRSAWKHFASIASIPIPELTIDDLQDCVDGCDRGKRTRENMKYLMTQLYRYAAARHLVQGNIAEYIYCGKENGERRHAFSMDQVEQIFSAVERIPGADYTACMIYTGFRPNEMLQLTRASYDAEHDCLIGGFKTEAGTNRIVPVAPRISSILRRLLAQADPWIFPDARGELLRDDVFREKYFYPLLDRLGIQSVPLPGERAYFVPYSCRHTFANLLKDVTGSDTDKAALMGHADASMTKYYQSADYDSLRKIVNSI